MTRKTKKKLIHEIRVLVVLSLFSILAVGGCASYSLLGGAPTYSYWDVFEHSRKENPGLAMYTYVLFGKIPSPGSTDEERFHTLLREITGLFSHNRFADGTEASARNVFFIPVKPGFYNRVKPDHEGLENEISKKKYELSQLINDDLAKDDRFCSRSLSPEFCINQKQMELKEEIFKLERKNRTAVGREFLRESPTVPLQEYNFDLSRLYLARIGGGLIQDDTLTMKVLSQPGPFLISTLKPIHQLKQGYNYILYADLSSNHPAAIPEVLAGYKKRIHSESINTVESFEPFRLWLLSHLLYANDNVSLVQTAVASWIPKEEN